MRRRPIPSNERSHTAIAERLRPWLALANLALPTTSEIALELDEIKSALRRARQVKDVRFLTLTAPLVIGGEEHGAKKFNEIFYAVRSILNQLLARKERPEDYRFRYLKALSGGAITTTDEDPLAPVEIARLGGPLTEQIYVENGILKFCSSSLLGDFRNAFTDVELSRFRRCEVCTAFYYAARKDKGACDQHLVLARTWEFRDKTAEYRENWRINKLVKLGFGLSKTRAAIVSRRKAGNSTMRGN